MKHATPRRLAVVAAAAFLGAGLTAAVAQPMGHAGYGGGDIVGAIARVKSELNLDTSQQAMWDSAVAASKSARAAMRSNRDSVRAALNAELAKPEVAAPLSLRWIRLGALPAAEPPLDADEALRRALARAPRLRSALPPGLETLGRALRRGRARAETRYTEYEGRLARAPLRLGLGGRALSPSRLERLASCAYRAFLQDALDLSAPEEAPAALAFDGRTTGELAHAALETAAKSALERGAPLGDLLLAQADALAARAVTRFLSDWEIDLPPVLAEVATEQLAALLRAIGELERARPDPLPLAGAEVRFGPGKGAEPAAGEGALHVARAGPRIVPDHLVGVGGVDVRHALPADPLAIDEILVQLVHLQSFLPHPGLCGARPTPVSFPRGRENPEDSLRPIRALYSSPAALRSRIRWLVP